MDEQKALELYAKYDSCKKVAKELGTYDEAVRRILIKHGVRRTGNRPGKIPKTNKRLPSNCKSKYCSALVIMLREMLGLPTGSIHEVTGVPTNAVVNIIGRKRPDLKLSRCQRIDTETIEAIEFEYVKGESSFAIGDKFNLHPASVTRLMRKRGHVRGKGGGAVRRANETRRKNAIEKLIEECGNVDDVKTLDHHSRRKILMANRKRDYGVTWKSIARLNGSLKCELCGIECNPNDKTWGSFGPTHPSVDHVVRICDGGEDTFENSRLVCMSCNLRANIEAEKKVKAHA